MAQNQPRGRRPTISVPLFADEWQDILATIDAVNASRHVNFHAAVAAEHRRRRAAGRAPAERSEFYVLWDRIFSNCGEGRIVPHAVVALSREWRSIDAEG